MANRTKTDTHHGDPARAGELAAAQDNRDAEDGRWTVDTGARLRWEDGRWTVDLDENVYWMPGKNEGTK